MTAPHTPGWNLAPLSGVPPTAWRNGGGTTRELLAWPAEGDWQVRISVAEIARDGPFSAYPGVQRWFAVLEGAGVRLALPEGMHELTPASTPLCFGGDAAPGCTLIDGPTQDFNLMLRGLKGRLTHVAGSLLCSVDAPRLIAVYPRQPGVSARFEQQEVQIPSHTLAWRVASRDGAFAIAGDALCIEVGL